MRTGQPTRDGSQSPERTDRSSARLPAFATGPVVAVALVMAAVLTALSGRYGFHRDELYFVEAGRRLAWGYVDQPPLTPLLARLSTGLFGDTPMGLRVVAMLVCVAIVVVAALVTRELNGGRGAQVLTAVAVATSSAILTTGHMLATSTFDNLAWLVLCLLVLRMVRTGDGRWYLAIGAVTGIALLNKFLVVVLVGALLVALLAVGPRKVLGTWWLAAGAAVALAVAAPTLFWQAAHGWPQLTVASGISTENGVENRVTFLPFQLVYLAPPYAALWLAGIWRLLRDPAVRWARALPVTYLMLVVLMLAVAGKPYYLLGLLIALLAAGSEPVLRWARKASRAWVVPTMVVLVVVVNVGSALPVWPVDSLNAVNAVNKEQGEQVGWPELAGSVAGVWRQLPAGEQDRAVIFTQNYGEASAIDRYGRSYGLPRAYSGHMSFADWGVPPGTATGPVLLVSFAANAELTAQFRGCRVAGTVDNGHGVDNPEQGTVLQLCDGPRLPWPVLWPQLRHYY